MSNRTLLEINHDCLRDLDGKFLDALRNYVAAGSTRQANVLADYGVRIIAMRHHSEDYHIRGRVDGFPATYSENPT